MACMWASKVGWLGGVLALACDGCDRFGLGLGVTDRAPQRHSVRFRQDHWHHLRGLLHCHDVTCRPTPPGLDEATVWGF